MRRVRGLLVGAGVLAVAAAGAAGAGVAAAGPVEQVWEPPPSTIVWVSGDAANGFGVRHYDGTVAYLPTDSEAIAECGEYDTYVERVRCRVQVRTWYADLTQTRRAIAWARYASRSS